jgi:ATP-dependent helicase HrpA
MRIKSWLSVPRAARPCLCPTKKSRAGRPWYEGHASDYNAPSFGAFRMTSDTVSLNFDALAARLDHCMLRDRHYLRKRLRGLRERGHAEPLAGLAVEIERSAERAQHRQALVPKITYDDALPIVQRRDDIRAAIAANQVVILCGETGSGKTTQLPKILLEMGRGVFGTIGHTQPRRVAARSVAQRIADELDRPLGQVVGYKVRFGDKTSADTLVKLMTDGILLAEVGADRFLEQYDTIIIDEAHERSLNIDFLLGTLAQQLPRRPDLKLIVTSATINPQLFSRHFSDAPIVEVSGRAYPVEVRYRPVVADDIDAADEQEMTTLLSAVDEVCREGPGDVLVFLTGERDIREAAEELRKHHPPNTEILPLYARLSVEEQMRVFQPHQKRRIVLATNVAETSLTVPGIRYVVDTGLARVSRYSARNKVQRLPIEPISRASADQRKGRCGRVGPGVCVRLYSEEDFLSRPAFTEPEIQRTNLANVILQMKAQRLGEVQEFPFVEPPDYRQVKDGYQTLHELGAVDDDNALTPVGHDLAKLPVDPRVSRMILEATHEGCLSEVLIIAAALSVQDPRERPLDQQQAADEAHRQWRDERSDFLSLLKLWAFFNEQGEKLSHSKLRKACRQNFVSYVRMREWRDVHSQLHSLLSDFGLKFNERPATYDEIHRALLSGLLANVGQKTDTHEYEGPRSAKFSIFPGSSLFSSKPRWVMAAEIVQTTKLYARTVAAIKPEWIERLGAHLVKKTWFEPHYFRAGASVSAFERQALYGLVIVPRRRVHYGPIDPKVSREIFIQAALVEGQYESTDPWRRHNDQLVRDVELLEAKARRKNLLTDAASRFAFYDARIPTGVFSGKLFEEWRHTAEKQDKRKLFMAIEDLIVPGSQPVASEQFPDFLETAGERLKLEYVFDPSEPDDGVTAIVPLAALNRLSQDPFDWLVPGMLRDKVEAMIRLLPKPVRVKLVPVPEVANRVTPVLLAKKENAAHVPRLNEALAWELGKIVGEIVPTTEWADHRLPDYLRFNFRIVDETGKILGQGRDLVELRHRLAANIEKLIRELPGNVGFNRDGIRTWDFGDLPERIEVDRPGIRLIAYPAVLDDGNTVALRLLDSPDKALATSHAGIRRLFMIEFREELSHAINALPDFNETALRFKPLGSAHDLKVELRTRIADRLLYGDDPTAPIVRTQAEFSRRVDKAWDDLAIVSNDTWRAVRAALAEYQVASLQLSQPATAALATTISDLRTRLSLLIPNHFISSTPAPWFKHLPRLIKAYTTRSRKLLAGGTQRDQQNAITFNALWEQYLELRTMPFAEIDVLRWMLEELHVSFFAQELKTSVPISVQRVEQQLMKISRLHSESHMVARVVPV